MNQYVDGQTLLLIHAADSGPNGLRHITITVSVRYAVTGDENSAGKRLLAHHTPLVPSSMSNANTFPQDYFGTEVARPTNEPSSEAQSSSRTSHDTDETFTSSRDADPRLGPASGQVEGWSKLTLFMR